MQQSAGATAARCDVLVVDGANVVGSRPDGWWKDRPGAAARLHARLLASRELAPRVVLVLEGLARAGVPEGTTDAVEVVHAPGEGDSRIVEEVGRAVTAGKSVAVVTADRGLTALAEDRGASVRRPGWLLGLLEPLASVAAVHAPFGNGAPRRQEVQGMGGG